MTILGRGDLSPPRRPRRTGRAAAVVAVLALLGAGGYFGWRAWHGGDSSGPAATATPCVTPSLPPSPAPPSKVTLAVLNTTKRDGLAHHVARELRARGFHVARVGNTKPLVAGVGSLGYGPGDQAAALSLAEQVPGVTPSAAPRAGVTLRIGSGFSDLASPEAAASARARDAAAASPRPAVCGRS